jgi:multiple sugar transport system substrate-binding protein
MSAMSRDWDRRSVLRAAAGMAALGGLAACGSNNGRSDGGSGGGKAISQWYHQYGEKGTQQAALKFAKAYDKANVKVQWIAGDYDAKLTSGLLSSSGPDVFEYHPNLQMVQSKQIVPLDDILADVRSDFNPKDIASHTVDGKVYGVRMIDDPQFLWYRKSLFAAAGVQVPTTLDELVEAAAKLTKGKMKGLYLGNAVTNAAKPLVWATGGDLLDANNKPTYHTDEVVAGLKTLRKLYTSGHLLLGAPTEAWDPSSLINELCAMQWCGMWAMPQILAAFPGDIGIFPFPTASANGKPAVYNGGWSTFVSAKAKDVDAAKAFVKWLWIDQKKYQEEWSTAYGFHIPPRTSLAAAATKLKAGLPAEGVKLFNDYGHFDNPVWTTTMNTAFEDVFADSVRGSKDPEASLDKCDSKVDRELKQLFG